MFVFCDIVKLNICFIQIQPPESKQNKQRGSLTLTCIHSPLIMYTHIAHNSEYKTYHNHNFGKLIIKH